MESKTAYAKLSKKVSESSLVTVPKKQLLNYFKPTPKSWRIAGDTMLLVGALAAIFVPGAKWGIAIGLVGKYITDMRTEKVSLNK